MTASGWARSDAEVYFDSLTTEDILATLHANREARRAQGARIIPAVSEAIDKAEPSVRRRGYGDFGHGARDDYNAMHLREGVALADRLIAAKGGKPRRKLDFWEYLAEWEAEHRT